MDFPETQQDEQNGLSKDDEQFIESVSNSVKLIDGHYSIGLPTKKGYLRMPNNKTVAEQRALSLKKRLSKDPSFRSDYVTFMSEMLKNGYAERIQSKQQNGVTEGYGTYHTTVCITLQRENYEWFLTAEPRSKGLL